MAKPLITPRNFQPTGQVFKDVYKTMLEQHPLAFDCIVFPAKGPEHDEFLADNAPKDVSNILNQDERGQQYDPPILARAKIIPDDAPAFGATESGLYENFHSARDAIKLLLSVEGLRLYSLVQWREYLTADQDDTVDRTVYVAEIKPVGRTMGAQMVYICRPLLADGEIPDETRLEPEKDEPASPPYDIVGGVL